MMERKDIVAMFLKEGLQLGASALDYLAAAPEKINEVIKVAKGSPAPQPIITPDLVRSITQKEGLGIKPETPDVKIIKKFFINGEGKAISISDYSRKLVDNYGTKKQLLLDRVDPAKLLSINKIQKQKDFTLICMIQEKDQTENSAIVEDLTGHITVYFEDAAEFDPLLENDVIAIVCEASAAGIMAKQILWPDVPLRRAANKTKSPIFCSFISDFHMDSKNFNKERYEKFIRRVEEVVNGGVVGKAAFEKIEKMYIFILGGISQEEADAEKLLNALPKKSFKIFLSSKNDTAVEKREDCLHLAGPAMVEIEGIKFLLCRGEEHHAYKQLWGDDAEKVMKNLLKRRDLAFLVDRGGVFILSKETIIEQPPDIFAFGGFHSPSVTNYKGVSLITAGNLSGEAAFWVLDLKTRDINKLSL